MAGHRPWELANGDEGTDMACCGQSVRRAAAQPLAEHSGLERTPVLFEYRGEGALTVFGRTTGRRYHFPSGGARVYVDGRDAPVLEITRGLDVVDV
jgi:hypothetical protein